MGKALGRTAAEIGVSERTLRRYVNGGLLEARRVAGQLELSSREARYLRGHHALLTCLRVSLRTERDVRLAVLFGSAASGDDTASSDVDLLVSQRSGALSELAALRRRLQDALDRPVHLVRLEDASVSASLMIDILDEGRVIVDRDDGWAAIAGSRELIARRARREEAALARRAAAAVTAARRRARP